jgi:hypothetical protein
VYRLDQEQEHLWNYRCQQVVRKRAYDRERRR